MNQIPQSKKRVVIVGGGTAGWIAANLMAKYWLPKGFEITVVESPDIGIIGVGEGSTPPLKGFMDTIGAEEADWMPQCKATYKNGIRFNGWSTKPGFATYFHPFLSQPDEFTAPAFFHNSFLRRKGVDLEGHPDHFFLTTYLAEKLLAPTAPENFPFEVNYGYHFDSGLLGKYLHNFAAKKGVAYRSATITEVLLAEDGNIQSLRTDAGDLIEADIFVDCTGFRSQLMQQALKEPFRSYSNSLFNDSCVVFPTMHKGDVECQTRSTALKYGWAFAIPLTHRIGNGYVYSSAFCDADKAETEFRAHLGLLESDVQSRHLKMKVGRVERHWVKNCLAIGLSQGFIEPLEATALDLVQHTVAQFISHYESGQFTDQYRQEFNSIVNTRFDAVRDYIVCHFKITSRTDTDYWLACAKNENLSDSLRSILISWVKGMNITDELEKQKLDAYFPNMSWNCLLTGKGIYPQQEQLRKGNELANQYDVKKLRRFIERCGLNFPSHAARLAELNNRPDSMAKIA